MTVSERRQYWAEQIAAQKASGLNITEWCAEYKLNRRQFHFWVRNLEKLSAQEHKPARSNWVEVSVENKGAVTVDSILVIRVGAATIELKPGFSPSVLADAVRILQTVC